jgi:hypothetical protein
MPDFEGTVQSGGAGNVERVVIGAGVACTGHFDDDFSIRPHGVIAINHNESGRKTRLKSPGGVIDIPDKGACALQRPTFNFQHSPLKVFWKGTFSIQ